jgi:hypothetical protein
MVKKFRVEGNVKRTPKLLSIENAREISRTLNIETQFNSFLVNKITKEDMLTLIDLNRSKAKVRVSSDPDKPPEEDKIRMRKELVKLTNYMNDVSDLINFVSSYEA